MPILSPEQQAAAREMDKFAIFRDLVQHVTNLDDSLSFFGAATPQVFEARALNVRDTIRAIAITAEQIELAIWADDTRAWALADSIRVRAALLWDEWQPANSEQCLWKALERAGPIRRQLRAISRLCELLQIEMTLGEQRSLLRSA
jgi:hypothetical protein